MSTANVPGTAVSATQAAPANATATTQPVATPVAVPAVAPQATAPASTPVASAPAADTQSAPVNTPVPATPPAATAPVPAPAPAVATSNPATQSSISPAPAPVVASENIFNFTEVTIIVPMRKELMELLTPKDAQLDGRKHFFIPKPAQETSMDLNAWVSGQSPLTVFASMDTNGTLKMPIVFGTELGKDGMAVIHLTGQIVHQFDSNGKLIGTAQMRALDQFMPPPPVPAQTQTASAAAAQ